MSDFWSGRNVLVTGAGGFLGGYLSKQLLDLGANVTGLDVVTESACLRVHGIADDVEMIVGDVLNLDETAQIFRQRKVGAVFHLAGQSMIEGAAAGPFSAFELNVRGTWNVLEAARRSESVEAIATASSNHTYGPQESAPFLESAPLNQIDPYGASKAASDIITRSYAAHGGVNAVAVRNVNSFGGGDPHLSHIVTGSVISLLNDERPIIRSDGSPVKAYLHASDTMAGYIQIAERASEAGVRGEAFNLTPARPVSALQMVETIVEVSGKPHLTPLVESSDLSQKDFFEHLSDQKTTDRIGWKPKLSLEEGLRQTYNWYEEHGTSWLE